MTIRSEGEGRLRDINKPANSITNWTSKNSYVDVDTGETLTKHRVKQDYIIIKIKKDVTINKQRTSGCLERTILCRRNSQGKLPFSGSGTT